MVKNHPLYSLFKIDKLESEVDGLRKKLKQTENKITPLIESVNALTSEHGRFLRKLKRLENKK